ncbi:hypothetical protein OH76DRAFT_1411818 [Lentinus brumalis]|uniref:HNH nuclease domain-containing protein n=1 Tax=Lentinus brumalis TaxID=2498619 RepID=A0A371CN72_9APHY|nr:hypothetical protein OH76DRAFT_1411818 [Polyporus brumalis]
MSATGTHVKIHHMGILQYQLQILKPQPSSTLPMIEDHELLLPGDYVCVFEGAAGTRPHVTYNRASRVSLASARQSYLTRLSVDCRKIPIELIQQKDSTTNGSKRCILTGTSEPADIVTEWIFPPALSHKIPRTAADVGIPVPAKKQRDSGQLEYTTPSNLIVMRKELYELFEDNAFSIDVDDGFKVYRFNQSAVNAAGLPKQLEGVDQLKEMVPFLRAHFHWTLSINFLGGAIENEWDINTIRQFRERMGLVRDPDFMLAPPEDQGWDSLMGQDAKKLMEEGVWKEIVY